jgi:hypothetical protein
MRTMMADCLWTIGYKKTKAPNAARKGRDGRKGTEGPKETKFKRRDWESRKQKSGI